ncbi:hypothetical protein [Lyticum sinuosum]|uniref:Uncharacterized protein n=1 Tax=Lyticum sinuosum TaxID=1332059 RepID=A0AAE5AI42_9RICK|nr:hypothetical protein [Lyticum sinuosum]MDZ5761629.1 hypothetical protein [Lyticum sinuosum]
MQQSNQIPYEIVISGNLIGFKDEKLLINKQQLNKQINEHQSKIIKNIEKEKSIFLLGSNELFKDQDFVKIAWEKEKELRIQEEKWKIGKELLNDIVNEIFKGIDFKFDTNKILLNCDFEPGRKDLDIFEKKLKNNSLYKDKSVQEIENSYKEKKNSLIKICFDMGLNQEEAELNWKKMKLEEIRLTMDYMVYNQNKNEQKNIKEGVNGKNDPKNVVKNAAKKEDHCCKLY